MFFQTTVRFVSALVGSLAAFYLAAHFFHAIGYMTAEELQRVGWMYRQLLSPITSLDWMTQKTALIVCGALAAQALLLAGLSRRWSYQPVKAIDPLERQMQRAALIEASGSRLPSQEMPIYQGLDQENVEPMPAKDPAAEEQRLMMLLGRRA